MMKRQECGVEILFEVGFKMSRDSIIGHRS